MDKTPFDLMAGAVRVASTNSPDEVTVMYRGQQLCFNGRDFLILVQLGICLFPQAVVK